MFFKLIFDKNNRKVLGAQAIGKGNADKRIDVIATAIKFGATIDDLTEIELCYAPPYSTAKDVVNMAGYVASNLADKSFTQITPDKIRDLVESGAYIVDVREASELEKGRIIGSHHIPLSELRNRYQEIPKDRPVYLHCRSGQRSYNAALALQNRGYTNVINVAGGFLSISYYEYFNDKTLNRSPILTAYNFN
jgi:rhodanese-related sulfurtransferase